jgi:tetratricopeptide (TPR) repeat protein
MNAEPTPPAASAAAAIDAALRHHRAGDLATAEGIYRRVLAHDPDHVRALGLLGACLAQAGRPREATPMLLRAASLRPDAATLANLANALHESGRHEEALPHLDRAIVLDGGNPGLHVNRANVLRALARHAAAVESCRRALRIDPRHLPALLTLGDLQRRLGDPAAAVETLATALRLSPALVPACYNLGVVLQDLGRWDEARERLESVLALQPGHIDARVQLGSLFQARGQPAEALAWLDRALDLDAGHVAALVCRGHLHQAQGRYELALRDYDRALALGATDPGVHFTRADALRNLRRYADAIDGYGRALALRADHPDAAKAHMNKGACHLLLGQFEAGWPELEWRWGDPAILPPHRHSLERLWLGETDPAGKTLLVHAEQGLGDTIHLSRYVPELARRGARVLLEAQPALHALLRGLEGCSRLLEPGEARPAFDGHLPMFSLPLAMRTRRDSIPAHVPYLRAPEPKIAAWHARLGPRRARRVGIAWAGSATFRNDARRSIALARLAPFLARERGNPVEWVSLQRDVAPADRPVLASLPVRQFSFEGLDFSDTAALVTTLDLVISVDTAVAHLAGALARPVWILLPLDPDWRWMLEREDSPWYPTARLFRQPSDGDWEAVLERVARALDALAAPDATDPPDRGPCG